MQAPIELQLSLTDERASGERLQQLTMELATDLRRETDVKPRIPASEEAAEAGSRGDALEIGKLVVQLVSGGSMAALISVLAAHFTRKPKMTVTVTDQNGRTITLSGENTTSEEMEQMLRRALAEPAK